MNKSIKFLKQIPLYLVFILLISVLFSCNSDKLTPVTETTEYNKIIYSIDKDSLKQGLFVELTLENDTISKANYTNNKLDGERYIYSGDGYLETLETYDDGAFDGPIINYYPDGTVMNKGEFINDSLGSPLYTYYESGELKEKISIRENLENGPFEEYYKNGQVHWSGTFIDGDNEVGLLLEYDESGTLIKKMDCGLYKGQYICQTIWDIENGDVTPKFEYE